MKRCPITYLPIENGDYSKEGLFLLSPLFKNLKEFPYAEDRQYELLAEYSDKLSFSGVQPKLNAKLNPQKEVFEVVAKAGTYIIKLQKAGYPELPQNEDLTMKLAELSGILVPKHGMMYASGRSLVYFIERFDRQSRQKFHVEDLAQVMGLSRDTKYESTMEEVCNAIDKFCTFPVPEKKRLFLLTMFNFLVGNEDMHVKNYSLLTKEGVVALSPAYDLVNSTMVMNSKEEIALCLRGKKSNLKRKDFIEYFAKDRLRLSETMILETVEKLKSSVPSWSEKINHSFLSDSKKKFYLTLVEERSNRLFG